MAKRGRIRRSWRLTRAAWDLVRSHWEMQALAFMGVLFAGIAAVLILYLGGYFEHPHQDRGHLLGVALLAGYASTLISVFFNVALAAAADEAMDGERMTLGEALEEAMRNFGSIALWSLISLAVGVVLNAIARRIPWGGRLVEWLAGTAWALATIFVVPLIALESAEPVPAIRRSAKLFKRRWGEGISGTLTITAWTVVAMIPAVFAIAIGFGIADRNPGAGTLWIAAGFLTIIVTWVLASAARGVFAVALYRYALDEPTESFPIRDIADPFEGRKSS
jgi:hypothetical protein